MGTIPIQTRPVPDLTSPEKLARVSDAGTISFLLSGLQVQLDSYIFLASD